MAITQPQEAYVSADHDAEKHAAPLHDAHELHHDGSDTDSTDIQAGVKRVEAITTVWSSASLWSTFALLWLVCFVSDMLGSIEGALSPYITSSFSKHGLLAVISIAARIIGGVVTLSVAKIIDLRGRMEGFIGALCLIVIGMIMKATCTNVEMYAAAQVFWWVGKVSLSFIIDVFVADITTLRNRMIIFTLNATPSICTTFAGPKISEIFLYQLNFRWAFGAFLIILIIVSLPVLAILYIHERKAKKAGVLREKSGRTTLQSLKHYAIEFDLIGALLITAGFTLILLPFSLVQSSGNSWASGKIIAMIVVGVVSLGGFAIWERFFARVQFFPFAFLKDRTVLGAAITYFMVFMTTFIWDAYYSSYLQVVHGLSITIANYVLNAYSLTAYFTGPFVALFIRQTGWVKWPAMVAVPIYLMAVALLVYFRTPSADVGYLTMCQVLVGFSTGMLTTTSQLAIMASVRHQDVAVAIAIWGLFGSVGSSVGFAIAGGMWTNILPAKLYEFLPEDSKSNATLIYGDIKEQMAEPIGTPIRDAVIHAYGDVMRKMAITGACLIPVIIISVGIWRNFNAKKESVEEKKRKGTVF